ncbi:MAG: HNH endonuclease signature motif containing protein [Acidimicrobiia bacterium]
MDGRTCHIKPWDDGGTTVIRNGQLLCRMHHRWKHRDEPGPNSPAIFDDSPLIIRLE